MWTVTLLAAALAVVGCEADPTPAQQGDVDDQEQAGGTSEEASCDQIFADVAASGDEATDEDLYLAVATCPDVSSFAQAASDHPEVLGDTEPQVWLARTCDEAQTESVTASAICAQVAGEGTVDPGDGEDEQDDEGDA